MRFTVHIRCQQTAPLKNKVSREPETVLILESGHLALSTGPVRTPDGRHVANYSSVWRKNADGQWKIVFDKGYPECPKPAAE
ncbi:hypothetical protein [Emcibacter sp.]|uniref:YybH family protein n=1 Tax=Emcibacter sp. TaxID=1979954 RepID=UPI002AA70042|nr:hypothetical protein [Emcibacter sp.]